MKEKILKGKKVFLRHPKVEDFAEFVALNKASQKFHKNLVNTPLNKKRFDAYLGRNSKMQDKCFFICRRSDSLIVGAINLSQISRGISQNAFLGYFLGERFTGCGFMTEAIELVLRYSFRTLKLHRIEANVQPHNAASIKILQKTGFTKEGFSRKYLKIGGRWRDHERWAIIREGWKIKKQNGNERS